MIGYSITSETLIGVVRLDEVKEFIRVTSTSEDATIQQLVSAAIKQTEAYLNNYVTAKTVVVKCVGLASVQLRGFGIDITSVNVNSTAFTGYELVYYGKFPQLEFTDTILTTDKIEITYDCTENVTDDIRLFIKQLAGKIYGRNEDNPISPDYELLRPYKLIAIA